MNPSSRGSPTMEQPTSSPISRARASQVWQWIHHGVPLAEGPRVTAELVRDIEREEMEKIKSAVGADFFAKGRYDEAREIRRRRALKGFQGVSDHPRVRAHRLDRIDRRF